jgi:hypothetical protein
MTKAYHGHVVKSTTFSNFNDARKKPAGRNGGLGEQERRIYFSSVA